MELTLLIALSLFAYLGGIVTGIGIGHWLTKPSESDRPTCYKCGNAAQIEVMGKYVCVFCYYNHKPPQPAA